MAPPVGGRGVPSPGGNGAGVTRRDLLAFTAFGMVAGTPEFAVAAGPQGQLTWGVHTTLAPTWFDPAETPGIITPWMVLYALHDALVKPMPGNPLTPSLAESFSAAEDALTYDFVLRPGVKFHNGEPVTAEDVKFSLERYRGSSAKMIKDAVAAVETRDARHIRFRLKEPWPDFLTYYASASGAGWIVPKKYVEKVGDDGYKKAPIGAGPYKFASFSPGVELVFEAFEPYWRKIPSVKRLVFKVIPEETTRLAALKTGEVDIVYAINGELAKELRNTPGLTLKPVYPPGPFWLYFPEQWDATSPWHDEHVRRAANLAIDRNTINEALTLGFSKLTNSIIPDMFEYAWKAPPPVFDAAMAKKLLAGPRQRLRCRRLLLRFVLGEPRRDSRRQSPGGGHPRQAAPARTSGFFRGVRQQEAQEYHPGRERRLRERRDPSRRLRRQGRYLFLWQLPGDRRPLPAAGGRTGYQAARGNPAQDAAAGARQGDLRAHMAAGIYECVRAPRRRVGVRPHSGFRLYRAV